MHLTARDLKQFAFDRSVKPRGSKHELIQELVASVDLEAIEGLLKEKLRDDRQYIRITVDNFPLLKKYMWAEIHRLDLYLGWVRLIHCLGWSPQKPSYEPVHPAADTSLDCDMKPWTHGDGPSKLTRTELRLVRRVWDSRCDETVRGLADKYAWDAWCYIGEAIAAYLPPDKLEQFKQACEENETHVWYNLLMYYGQMRLAEMKVRIRKPRQLNCAECGKRFLESSIPASIAERVDRCIQFCRNCCTKAFYEPSRSATGLSRDDMLERLAALAATLEGVPSGRFVQNPRVAGFSEEKLVAVIRALIHMPPYKAFVNTFGSWLRALVLAGVLEGGTQRTGRGIRCIATDGHVCLSLSEKTIDDWLSANGIAHEKEPRYPYDRQLNPAGLRADWRVGKTFIEYAGMMIDPEYAARVETKKRLCAKLGIALIVLEPEDVLNLDRKLAQILDEQGCPMPR